MVEHLPGQNMKLNLRNIETTTPEGPYPHHALLFAGYAYSYENAKKKSLEYEMKVKSARALLLLLLLLLLYLAALMSSMAWQDLANYASVQRASSEQELGSMLVSQMANPVRSISIHALCVLLISIILCSRLPSVEYRLFYCLGHVFLSSQFFSSSSFSTCPLA
jgi:hypothetical protein